MHGRPTFSTIGKLCFMAWDLWGLPHDQDIPEGSDSMQYGCRYDFCFCNGLDVIEERAKNEDSCIQVLRVLITNADTKIDELEKNLVFLRTELAFAEHKECSELCVNSLRDKIHSLEISIRSLRNKCEKDDQFQSSMHGEPAETIHDMLRGLLSRSSQENAKQKQPSQVTIFDLKSHAPEDSSELCENRELRQSESSTIVKEENRESDTPTERCASTNSSSKFQEKANSPNTKPADTNTTCPDQDYLRHAPGSSDVGKKLVMSESDGITRKWKAIEQELSFMAENVVENASSKPEEKSSEIEVVKAAEAIVKAHSSGSRESSNTCLSVGRSLFKSDLKANGNIKANGGIKNRVTEDSHPEGNRAHENTAEHSNAIVNYISPDTLIRSAALKAMNKTSGFKVTASSPAKTENYDMDQKLIDLKRAVRKECFKDSKVFVLNKFNSSNSWSKTMVNKTEALPIATTTKHVALTLQAQLGNKTIKAELEVREPIVEESNKAIILYGNSHLNLGSQPQSLGTKRKFQSDSQSIIGPIFHTRQSKLNPSSVSSYKRQKSDSDDENASIKQLMSGKNLMKSATLECHNKENGTSVAMVEYSLSQPLESKRTTNLPFSAHRKESSVNLNVSRRHAAHNGSVDNDPHSRTLVQLPPADERLCKKLSGLKVNELKNIARKHKMKSYSKLKKEELIQFLAKGLGNQINRILEG